MKVGRGGWGGRELIFHRESQERIPETQTSGCRDISMLP